MSSMVKRLSVPLALLCSTSAMVPASAQQQLVPESFAARKSGAPTALLPAARQAAQQSGGGYRSSPEFGEPKPLAPAPGQQAQSTIDWTPPPTQQVQQQAPVPAQPQPATVQPLDPAAASQLQQQWDAAAAQLADPSRGNIPAAFQRWKALSQSDNLGFADYAGFLMSYPGWPGEERMRKNAEQSIELGNYSPSQLIGFFQRFEPVTNTGRAQYAIALANSGDRVRALDWARKAWTGGPLSDTAETMLLGMFGAQFTPQDYDRRIDSLIWAGATGDAGDLLAYATPEKRQLFMDRLAIKTGSGDRASALARNDQAALSDPGYLTDRATYGRANGQSWETRQLLANRPNLASYPEDPEEWYETLLVNARAAENDNQNELAYRIASRVEDAFPLGTDITAQPLGVRDDYTSLTWLAGQTAYYKLGRPRDAARMFALYGAAARSPQTITKGLYWAAKASQQAGDTAAANQYWEQAAKYYDHFYGQLALEKLGRPIPKVTKDVAKLTASGKPDSRPIYMAAQAAGQYGSWQDQSTFLRAIANEAKSEQEHLAAVNLSTYLGRPDLAVMAGRNARVNELDALIPFAFPTVPVPSEESYNWTMVHAIARQESQFDREARSHAGASGLMQLMPGTAREVAGRQNLSYSPSALTSDPSYNIRLGSSYFQRMLDYYDGNYPLAVAAYNAGPGNVNKFIRANGDPRNGGVDIVKWIEEIPIYETKNYVQRVLENAVMYDQLYPEHARFGSGKTRTISNYLGN
ncbi:lytic transglycosylase domain-containing protein [Novosphingopyxis iocasae]|uniref:lytic transglycosylase domain-containing protein n=1 Tax=Novosphingopyxis iocasae TaxID=2762729 RepID=UPI001FEB56C0|nr:lytic transglycosylase domain-containing protein [Novosphingopyxis iocasae]